MLKKCSNPDIGAENDLTWGRDHLFHFSLRSLCIATLAGAPPVSNPSQLVGDYTNSILKPWAEIVKQNGEICGGEEVRA